MMGHMIIKPTRIYAQISSARESPASVDCSYLAAACSSVNKAHALSYNGALRQPLIVRKHIVQRKAQQQHYYRGCSVRLNVRCKDEGSLPKARELDATRSVADDAGHAALVGSLGELYKLDAAADTEEHPYSHLELGARWPEIQGAGDWKGLLDPIDPVLRAEIIRYGEFAQATYDAFDFDPHSKFCGSCRFSKHRLLDEVSLHNRGYEITDYLYATAGYHFPHIFRSSRCRERWSKDSNWMGFVAVSTSPTEMARLGRRDIVVAWRGTVTKLEWIENLMDVGVPAGLDPRQRGKGTVELKVESGFLNVYKSKNKHSRYNKLSARDQVLAAVKRLVEKYRDEPLSITLTGHSLGSALALICAYDIAESALNIPLPPSLAAPGPSDWPDDAGEGDPGTIGCGADDESGGWSSGDRVPIAVFSFAGPRVGNSAFAHRVTELRIKVLRVVNVHDRVTRVPGIILNEKLAWLNDRVKFIFHELFEKMPHCYCHVGVPLRIDNLWSEFLERTTDPVQAHNMEAYLHLLDGFHGTGRPFQLTTPRDIALVNKASNFLKKHHRIPPDWWQEANKGLVQDTRGRWVVRERDPENFPEPDDPLPSGPSSPCRSFK